MKKLILFKLDNFLRNFLLSSVEYMPMRFSKMIAFFYADAVVRKVYLRKLGILLGEGSYSNLGLNCTVNDDYSPCVQIGKNVSIGPNVTFLPNSEPNNSEYLQAIPYIKNNLIKRKAMINVEDNVWIGSNTVILPGVTIKKGCIIGAGAVVLRDTEEFSIYAGNPAKKIRNLYD